MKREGPDRLFTCRSTLGSRVEKVILDNSVASALKGVLTQSEDSPLAFCRGFSMDSGFSGALS